MTTPKTFEFADSANSELNIMIFHEFTAGDVKLFLVHLLLINSKQCLLWVSNDCYEWLPDCWLMSNPEFQ